MQKKFTIQTDTPVIFRIDSFIVNAKWLQKEELEHSNTALEVKTSYVGEDAEFRITIYTSNKRKLAKLKGTVNINFFNTMFTIPEKIKPGESLLFERSDKAQEFVITLSNGSEVKRKVDSNGSLVMKQARCLSCRDQEKFNHKGEPYGKACSSNG